MKELETAYSKTSEVASFVASSPFLLALFGLAGLALLMIKTR